MLNFIKNKFFTQKQYDNEDCYFDNLGEKYNIDKTMSKIVLSRKQKTIAGVVLLCVLCLFFSNKITQESLQTPINIEVDANSPVFLDYTKIDLPPDNY